jgi:cell wall-associated NlpC family hydrolase
MKIFVAFVVLTIACTPAAQARSRTSPEPDVPVAAPVEPEVLTKPVVIPVGAPLSPVTSPAPASQDIVASARAWQGTPYRYSGDSRSGIDCSHFVYAVYSQFFPGFGYRMAREYLNDPKFSVVTVAQPGDIIVFPSYRGSSDHVGIVTDPQNTRFIGSQTSTGVAEANFTDQYYWGKRPHRIMRMNSGAK